MEVDKVNLFVKVYEWLDDGDGGPTVSRSKRTGISINGSEPTVEQLLQSILAEFPKLSSKKIVLVYKGRSLEGESPLSNYSVKNGSIINVMARTQAEASIAVTTPTDAQVMSALTKLMNPSTRPAVEKILSTTDTLDRVIRSSPALQRDLMAQALMRNTTLIQTLYDCKEIESVLAKHPCLGPATIQLCEAVMKEVKKMPANTASAGGASVSGASYSLDRMSGDEEEQQPSQRRRVVPSQPAAQAPPSITAGQLAAALRMSTASSQPPQSSTASSSQPAAGSSITRSQLSAALSQALGSAPALAPPPAAVQPSPNPPSYDSQLQQLRDMGITDDRAALEALHASGGDIHMALEILYGSDMQ